MKYLWSWYDSHVYTVDDTVVKLYKGLSQENIYDYHWAQTRAAQILQQDDLFTGLNVPIAYYNNQNFSNIALRILALDPKKSYRSLSQAGINFISPYSYTACWVVPFIKWDTLLSLNWWWNELASTLTELLEGIGIPVCADNPISPVNVRIIWAYRGKLTLCVTDIWSDIWLLLGNISTPPPPSA